MTITYELDLTTFEAWCGGEDTLNRIIDEGKTELFESILEELYPEGMTECQLNDILRFESEWVYETLGIRSESQIEAEIAEVEEEIAEVEEEIAEVIDDYENDIDIMSEAGEVDAAEELWMVNYKDYFAELKDKQAELEEKLSELKEELSELY